MRSYSVPFVENRLHMPVKGDDFGFDSDLFHQLPGKRGGERLPDLDPAARQTEMALQRRARPADDQRPAFPKHRRRNREDRAGGKQPIIHGFLKPYSLRMVESLFSGRGSSIGSAVKRPSGQSPSPYEHHRGLWLVLIALAIGLMGRQTWAGSAASSPGLTRPSTCLARWIGGGRGLARKKAFAISIWIWARYVGIVIKTARRGWPGQARLGSAT